ncbi:TIGR01906 family membrane protein [Persephonella sp.]
MIRRTFILAVCLATAPLWIVGFSTRLAFSEWFIDFEYSRKDFPKDRWGLPDDVRKDLAKLGLQAVLSDEGLEKFKKARLPNGNRAFRDKEIRHMEDVKNFLKYFFPATYLSFIVWFGCFILLKEERWKAVLHSGLFTIGLIITVGLISYINYDFVFTVFHDYVFGEYTWRFRLKDTLLRIYPMKFWFDGTFFVIALSFFISVSLTISGVLLKKVYQ